MHCASTSIAAHIINMISKHSPERVMRCDDQPQAGKGGGEEGIGRFSNSPARKTRASFVTDFVAILRMLQRSLPGSPRTRASRSHVRQGQFASVAAVCGYLKLSIAKSEDVIEAIEDHLVVCDADDRGVLVNRNLAQQIHHHARSL